jgi:CotH kinase protein/Lamin Tail Domain
MIANKPLAIRTLSAAIPWTVVSFPAAVLAVSAFFLATLPAGQAAPIISEFMASNNSTLADQDGDFADWIELYNPDPAPVPLGGWYLTNKAATPARWKIPPVTLPSGGYLVIFCSEKNYTDPSMPMATNFTLAASGGFVALVEADGKTVASSYTFPAQYPDIAYGVTQPAAGSEPTQIGFFAAATPGGPNGNHANLLLNEAVTVSGPPGIFIDAATVTLAGGSAGEHIRYTLTDPSPGGDQFVAPTAASPEFAGAVAIGSTQLLRAAVFSADDSQHGFVASAMYIQLDDLTANRLDKFTSTLPLLVFDDNGFGLLPNDHTFYPAWIGAFSPVAGVTKLTRAPNLFTPDTMKLHGFSSAGFPKQSYESALTDGQGRSLSIPFFGLSSDKSWDTISAWAIDRTYIHNAFVYSLSRAMGHWAPGTRFAEMFIHSGGGMLDTTSYAGVTALTERLKVGANRINISALAPGDVAPPSVTGGYIVRIDHPEVPSGAYTYYSWTTTQGTTLMIDTPKLDVLVQPQIDYITGYVQSMEDAMAADQASGYATRGYLGYLDRPSWVDYHLINVLVENVDAFLYSEYFSKDVNGLLQAGPVWDYDRSMDSGDGRDANPLHWTADGVGSYWDDGFWTYLTHDPDFMQLWVDRWQSLRLSLLSDANLKARITALAAEVGSDAAARDAARWPDNQSRFPGAWSGEIANMTAWITARAHWIDQQFVAVPVVQLAGPSRMVIPAAGSEIVYTTDGSDPRLSNGGISPAALVSGGPVALAAGQSFSARVYNPAMANVFPGSPWSSLVGGPDRLVNVSSRSVAASSPNVLIDGFVIAGPANSQDQVLLRAAGPSLAQFGLAGSLLAQPSLSLYDSTGTLIATNTGWDTSTDAPEVANAALEAGAFAFPSGSADCALLENLAPGAYTLQVSGVNQTTGVALGEVYELGSSGAKVINLSSRGSVAPGEPLITGVVISGSAPQQVLLRADGPSLGSFGVSNFLAQPILQLFDSSGKMVVSNTGWGTGANATQVVSASTAVGAFALSAGSADSAVLVTLQPGAYTMVVTGVGGTSGVALAESYTVP